MCFLTQLQKDLEEVKVLLEKATRKRVRDTLTTEKSKIETEIKNKMHGDTGYPFNWILTVCIFIFTEMTDVCEEKADGLASGAFILRKAWPPAAPEAPFSSTPAPPSPSGAGGSQHPSPWREGERS